MYNIRIKFLKFLSIFKYYKILASSISESHTFDLTTLFPNTYSTLTTNNFVVETITTTYSNIGNPSSAAIYITNKISNNILTTLSRLHIYQTGGGDNICNLKYNVYFIN